MSNVWRFGRQYDFHEIVADGIVHGVGIVFALVGATALIFYATVWGSLSAIAAAWIYGLGLVACLSVSFTYNIWPHSNVKWFLRRLDHSAIFLAIAGGYTPVSIAALDGWRQTAVLVVVWTGAAIGIALQWVPVHVPRAVFTAVYVVVGWSVSIALPQLLHGLGVVGFTLVLAGGVAYTAGAVVYALKRPDPWPTVFGYHEVFHLLTIVGAGLQFAAVAFVVSPKL